jgi:hypothetical protein
MSFRKGVSLRGAKLVVGQSVSVFVAQLLFVVGHSFAAKGAPAVRHQLPVKFAHLTAHSLTFDNLGTATTARAGLSRYGHPICEHFVTGHSEVTFKRVKFQNFLIVLHGWPFCSVALK